jgi:hypothetical protein
MGNPFFIVIEEGNESNADELANSMYDLWYKLSQSKPELSEKTPPEVKKIITPVNPKPHEVMISVLSETGYVRPHGMIFLETSHNPGFMMACQYFGEHNLDYPVIYIYSAAEPQFSLDSAAGIKIPDSGPLLNAQTISEYAFSRAGGIQIPQQQSPQQRDLDEILSTPAD